MPSPTPLIRPPTTLTPSSTSTPLPPFTPPPLTFLSGTWHVTHSTLPMWRSKRNVTITYTPLAPSTPSTPSISTSTNPSTDPSTTQTPAPTPYSPLPQLDDHVQYQTTANGNMKSIRGVDTATKNDTGVWEWRGRNWLMVARSRWEVLGWGPQGTVSSQGAGGNGESEGRGDDGEEWIVTYFAKTMFTPQGIDVYSRRKEGLSEGTLEGIIVGLRGVEGEGFGKLVEGVFEVLRE